MSATLEVHSASICAILDFEMKTSIRVVQNVEAWLNLPFENVSSGGFLQLLGLTQQVIAFKRMQTCQHVTIFCF